MRIPIIAGNWKMNNTVDEAIELVDAMVDDLGEVAERTEIEVVLCPPAISLVTLSEEFGDEIEDGVFVLGAQNMHFEEKGAFTGELAAPMLADYCDYVILGHSERRQYFGETDELVNKKVRAALKNELTPIICVGETLAQRDSGQTDAVVTTQVKGVLAGLNPEQMAEVVIAYEPVWAIGTGRAATAADANSVVGLIRKTAAALYSAAVADELPILYGGSVTAKNAAELMAQKEIDGALVGGASLKAEDFVKIVQEAARLKGVPVTK
jgi:triosephosphate isomerase (TIM)